MLICIVKCSIIHSGKDVMTLHLNESDTAFELLAILCSLLDKTEERSCAIKYVTVTDDSVAYILEKYKNF